MLNILYVYHILLLQQTNDVITPFFIPDLETTTLVVHLAMIK